MEPKRLGRNNLGATCRKSERVMSGHLSHAFIARWNVKNVTSHKCYEEGRNWCDYTMARMVALCCLCQLHAGEGEEVLEAS